MQPHGNTPHCHLTPHHGPVSCCAAGKLVAVCRCHWTWPASRWSTGAGMPCSRWHFCQLLCTSSLSALKQQPSSKCCFQMSYVVTRPVVTAYTKCTIGTSPHMQVLAEGLLHTVFANEEEAAAVLEAAAAHPAPGGGDAADSGRVTSNGTNTASSQQSAEPLQNGHSHAVDGCSTAAHCNSPPAQQGQVHDEAAAAAQRWLLRYCQVAVISLGPRGCMAQDRHGGTAACAADRCKDTTTSHVSARICMLYGAKILKRLCPGCSRQQSLETTIWLISAAAAGTAGWRCRTRWGRATASRQAG